MKRITYFFLILFIILPCVYSQDDPMSPVKGFIGSFGIGTAIPTGGLDNGWKAGLHVNANAGYLFNNIFGVRCDAAYTLLSIDAGAPYSGSKFTLVSFKGELLLGNFKRNRELIPYGIAGIGVNLKNYGDLKFNDAVIEKGFSETELGVDLGGGGAFKIRKNLYLFVEVKFNYGFGKNTVASFIPLTFGLMFTPK